VNVLRERLANQFLTGTPLANPVEVVRRLGAVQAQDYAGAKWAIGMRTTDATDGDVERAVETGRILRTHVLRPTWHFVLPEDIRWMLALTGPRVSQAMASYNRTLGLTPAVFRRSAAVIEKVLRDGAHLTRAELGAELGKARVRPATGQALAHFMMQAEVDGVICSGARRGKQFTYALLDHRAPPAGVVERDEALSRLAHLYFRGRGPATVHDFAWWSGLTIGDAKRGIESCGKALSSVTIGEKSMWMVERADAAPAPGTVAHLLPNYDEYFIGHRDRSFIGRRAGTKLVTGGNALINHILTIGGEIVGGWKRAARGATTVVDLALLTPLRRAERTALDASRARFEAFLEGAVKVELRR
jgi:hypothetical protein